MIKGETLNRTQYVFTFPDDVSSTPSDVQRIDYEVTVNREDVSELLDAIQDTGFSELRQEYGAPADQRHYLDEITVGPKTVYIPIEPKLPGCPASVSRN